MATGLVVTRISTERSSSCSLGFFDDAMEFIRRDCDDSGSHSQVLV